MKTRLDLHVPRPPRESPPPCPKGWYAVALSADLAPGRILSRVWMGQEVVVFRTEAGEAGVAGAHCPHLGAHLGVHGKVVGDELLCSFHGFRFACEGGACTATGYGTRPPKIARLSTFPVRERNQTILAWYDPAGAPPEWEIPTLDWQGWEPLLVWHYPDLAGHPQDMTENSVDTGHFHHAHGFRDIALLEPLATEGPSMRLRYRFKRPADPKTGRGRVLDAEATIVAHGVGVTVAEASVRDFGLHNRVMVYHTPTAPGHMDVWVLTTLRPVEHPERMNPLLGRLPRRLVTALLARQIHRFTTSDIQGDFPYLSNKRYLARPALAEGDGPIGRFRSWVRQFYVEGATP